MKKILGVAIAVIVIVIIVILMFLLGSGLGFGPGGEGSDGDGSGVSKTSMIVDAEEKESSEETLETNTAEIETPVDKGDKALTIAVSVVESSYFYQNKKITLDDFLAEMKEFDEDVIVEITDDNASLKAYNKLIDALEEIAITYTEK